MKQHLRHKPTMQTKIHFPPVSFTPVPEPPQQSPPPAIFDPVSQGGAVILQQLTPHPEFYEVYHRCQYHLMVGDGPLPLHYRHYIAIMACSEQRNETLFLEERDAFLATGGDPTWLEGIHRVPFKLRRLSELNKLLARAPWKLSYLQIKKLTRGEGNWSLAEIVQAVVILVHFHSGASFALGTPSTLNIERITDPVGSVGVAAPETDQPETNGQEAGAIAAHRASGAKSPEAGAQGGSSGGKTSPTKGKQPKGILRLHQGSRIQRKAAFEASKALLSKEAEMFVRFKDLEEELEMVLDGAAPNGVVTPAEAVEEANGPGCPCNRETAANPKEINFGKYLEIQADAELRNLDTYCIPDALMRDTTWDEEGHTVLSLFYGDMCHLFDDKYRVAQLLTYNYMGSQHVLTDTSAFRLAIWNFVQSLYGICKDDYDYDDIGRWVNPELVDLIENACRRPHRLLPANLDSVAAGLDDAEKVHIRVLVMEAKNQALALYATRAIIKYRCSP